MKVLCIIGWIILSLIGIFALCVLLSLFTTLFIDMSKKYDRDSGFYRWLLNAWTCFAVFVVRIHVKTEGLEKMPEGRFLLVQNHRSNFDPILTWFILKNRGLSFISKKENFKIFLFGRLIHRCCFREIDRQNPRNAMATVYDAADLIKNDRVSIGVYPEGTRNKNSENVDLLPFHNGVFKIAQLSKVPIVVTSIVGTETIHKNFPLHGSHVTFKVLEVMQPEEITEERTQAIGEKVRQLMLDSIAESKKKTT